MASSEDIRYALRIPSARTSDRDVFELDASMAEHGAERGAKHLDARARAGWRPLFYSWLAILAVLVIGGGVLEHLGPLPPRLRADRGPAEPEPTTAPPHYASASIIEPAQPQPQPAPAVPPPPPRDRGPATAAPMAPAPVPAAARPSGSGGVLPPPAEVKTPDPDRGKDVGSRDRVVVTIHPAGSDDGKAVAQQLATRAALPPDQVETGEAAGSTPRATVRFYAEEDHGLARRLGTELGGMGYTWQLDNQAGRPLPGRRRTVDVFLPRK